MLKRFKDFIPNQQNSTKRINESYELEFESEELVYQIDGKIYILSAVFTAYADHQPAEPEVGIATSYDYIDGYEPVEITYAEKFKDPSREADFKALKELGLEADFYAFLKDDDMIEVTDDELTKLSNRFIELSKMHKPGDAIVSIVDNNKILTKDAEYALEKKSYGWDIEPDLD